MCSWLYEMTLLKLMRPNHILAKLAESRILPLRLPLGLLGAGLLGAFQWLPRSCKLQWDLGQLPPHVSLLELLCPLEVLVGNSP